MRILMKLSQVMSLFRRGERGWFLVSCFLLVFVQVTNAGECFSQRCKISLKKCVEACFVSYGSGKTTPALQNCVNECVDKNSDSLNKSLYIDLEAINNGLL